MKKTKLFGWALVATMMGVSFSACSNDAEEVLAQESEIRLTSEITPSRAASNLQSDQIVEGQQIGVTITGFDDVTYSNKPWTADGNGRLSTTEKIYWKNSDITITAYHPYDAAWNGTFNVNTDQSEDDDYLNSDLLWAKTTASSANRNETITLPFDHKLAKINVTLQKEYDSDDLTGAIISICNTKTSATLDTSNGTTTATGDVEEIIAGTGTSASAIVVPQNIAEGKKFIKVSLGSKIFYYTLPAEQVLVSGKSYNYTLTVKATALALNTSSTLEDWGEGSEVNDGVGDANEIQATLTVELDEAGTLSNYLTNENKDVIEDLKIIGNINAADIQVLRNITSGAQIGALISLDLSEANIVAGGGTYEDYMGFDISTKDNIITEGMFGATNFHEIILPSNITGIETSAFEAMENLTTLTIPEGVTSIGEQAFYSNTGLTSITIPETVAEIGAMAFHSCEKLASIIIPSQVTIIEYETFYNCVKLSSITLPAGITDIGTDAFVANTFNQFHCNATAPLVLGEDIFANCDISNCTLYVPTGSKSVYEDADYWKNFNSIVEE